MASDSADDVPADGRPERRPSNTVELEDGRECWRFWVPAYVLERYAARIGQRGVALYCSLAWWLCRRAPHRRPTLAELGGRAGCSRATVWRGLRSLAHVGLIEIIPQLGPTGRRPHLIRLVHPTGVEPEDEDSGMEDAGGIKMSARRAQDERAARSICNIRALNLSAPTLFNQDLNVCVNSPETHTPDPAPPEDIPEDADEKIFSREWMKFLQPGAAAWTAAHEVESRWCGRMLLSRGWTLPELLATVSDPLRCPSEWPREYAERHGAQALRTARGSAQAVQERQERAQSLQSARLEAAQRGAEKAHFEALPAAKRLELEARILTGRPALSSHPAIVAKLAAELPERGPDQAEPH
jgi:hypothetical protein